MAISEEIKKEFERFRQEDIETYEAEVKAAEEGSRRLREADRRRTTEFQRLAAKNGLDLGVLEDIHKKEEKYLQSYLAEIRPPLVNRESQEEADKKVREFYTPAARLPGVEWPDFLGIYLLSPSADNFEGIEGEKGNPFMIPGKFELIKLSGKSKGSGSGCFTGIVGGPGTRASAVFSYMPTKAGVLEINARAVFHGFYIVRANDGCWDCKMARAKMTMSVRTSQSGIVTQSNPLILINYDDDNIDVNKTMDTYKEHYFKRLIVAGSHLVIVVDFDIWTLAIGGGSYSEINFKDSGNYIFLPCVNVSYK